MHSDYEAFRTSIHEIEIINAPTLCNPHYHEAIEILCVLDDDVSTLINGNERILRRGEIAVSDCYDVHAFNSFEKDVIVLIIPNEFLSDYMQVKGKKHLATPYINDKTAYAEIKEIMFKFSNGKLPTLLGKGYINVLLGIICEQCGFSDFSDSDISLMKSILNFLEVNYNEDIDLEFLAKHFGYSKYYFSRMFSRFFKFNLNEYLARLRIRRFISAMQADKNADILNTAFNCGFNSWQTFYRHFKQYYGTSPKKYLTEQ